MKRLVDIVIPSYKSRDLFAKYLATAVDATKPYLNKLVIVDDCSGDDIYGYLQDNFQDVLVFAQNQTNLGFTLTTKKAISQSTAPYFVLLNNDVAPKPKYLDSALAIMESDPDIFAVTFNEEQSSWPQVSWDQGKFQFTRGVDKTKTRYSAWASGGSSLIRRSIYDKLGGLSEVFAPAYWEDIDLGIRAWKHGYKIVWDKDAHVSHEHEASYGKINRSYLNKIKERNELLFIWQNFTDPHHLLDHLIFLVRRSLRHPRYLLIIFAAFTRFIRFGKRVKSGLSDDIIISKINGQYQS